MVEKEIDRVKRKILFRGKCKANNLWYYGFLYKDCFILDGEEEYDYGGYSDGVDKTWIDTMMYCVDKNTVGQFTGLYDVNGKEIFEGDILSIPAYLCCGENCVCVYQGTDTGVGFELIESKKYRLNYDGYIVSDEWEDFEVIGNIHDDPELLEV